VQSCPCSRRWRPAAASPRGLPSRVGVPRMLRLPLLRRCRAAPGRRIPVVARLPGRPRSAAPVTRCNLARRPLPVARRGAPRRARVATVRAAVAGGLRLRHNLRVAGEEVSRGRVGRRNAALLRSACRASAPC